MMPKDEFVSRMIKDQANRKKKQRYDIDGYMFEARLRMKRLYRGDKLRSKGR